MPAILENRSLGALTLRVMGGSVDNGVYDRLGGSWWDETSLLNVLHGSVTPGRFAYFRGVLARRFGAGLAGLSGLRVLDIGCGGGFLAEEFASLGCRVTGVDPSAASIGAARAHAAERGLRIDYRVGAGEELPAPDAAFGVACCRTPRASADPRPNAPEARREPFHDKPADRCQYAASRARSSAANATGLRAPASQSTVTTLASAAVAPAGVRIVSRVVRLVVPTRSTSIRTCSRRSA
jgi:SAM-dependent methyltransferase